MTHPVETDTGVETADGEVLLGAGLWAVRGEACTHAFSLALCFLIAALPERLEHTGLSAAQALTGAWVGGRKWRAGQVDGGINKRRRIQKCIGVAEPAYRAHTACRVGYKGACTHRHTRTDSHTHTQARTHTHAHTHRHKHTHTNTHLHPTRKYSVNPLNTKTTSYSQLLTADDKMSRGDKQPCP